VAAGAEQAGPVGPLAGSRHEAASPGRAAAPGAVLPHAGELRAVRAEPGRHRGGRAEDRAGLPLELHGHGGRARRRLGGVLRLDVPLRRPGASLRAAARHRRRASRAGDGAVAVRRDPERGVQRADEAAGRRRRGRHRGGGQLRRPAHGARRAQPPDEPDARRLLGGGDPLAAGPGGPRRPRRGLAADVPPDGGRRRRHGGPDGAAAVSPPPRRRRGRRRRAADPRAASPAPADPLLPDPAGLRGRGGRRLLVGGRVLRRRPERAAAGGVDDGLDLLGRAAGRAAGRLDRLPRHAPRAAADGAGAAVHGRAAGGAVDRLALGGRRGVLPHRRGLLGRLSPRDVHGGQALRPGSVRRGGLRRRRRRDRRPGDPVRRGGRGRARGMREVSG